MTKSILVVEDTEDNRRILNDLLSSAGFAMLEAHDGERGVEIAGRHRPDLILMDVHLPVIDGYEAIRRIRENPETRDIPIVAVTSHAAADDEKKAVEAGCVRYVSKPFSPRKVLALVREVLAEARG